MSFDLFFLMKALQRKAKVEHHVIDFQRDPQELKYECLVCNSNIRLHLFFYFTLFFGLFAESLTNCGNYGFSGNSCQKMNK